jgi:hypothetical protein
MNLVPSYHARLKDGVGELAMVRLGRDNTLDAARVRERRGLPVQQGQRAAAAWDNINPITGTAYEARAPALEMTEGEKERGMEKLFALFARFERNGANPMRNTIEKGGNHCRCPPDDDDE